MKSLLVILLLIGTFPLIAQPPGTVVKFGGLPAKNANTVVTIADSVLTNATSVVIGGANLVLKSDGTVIGWGWNHYGQATGVSNLENGSGPVIIDGQILSNVKAIAASVSESIALKSNGTVVIWGADNGGRKIDVPPDLTNVVAVAAGWDHCLALKQDGTVFLLWADSPRLLGVSNVVAIAAGQGYGFGRIGNDLMLMRDGFLKAFRGVYDESSSLPHELTNIVAIVAGGASDLALTRDGRVFGWGVNNRGQSTGVPTTNYIASGYVTIGRQQLTNVTAIAAGEDINLALKQDGTVAAWGGVGIFGFGGKPIVPEGLSNVVAIAAGPDYCLAITTNAAVAEKFRH